MRLNDLQRQFTEYLLGGRASPIEATLSDSIPPSRLGVYQRNVLGSLVDVLTANFPATCALAGEAAFHGLACDFIRSNPPRRPALWSYGGEFPRFLVERGAMMAAAMATLENGLSTAYFAEVVPPLAVERLVAVPVEQVSSIKFAFAPMVSVFPCPESVVTAFRHWRDGADINDFPSVIVGKFLAHHVLTARDGDTVYHRPLPGWQGVFLAKLYEGESFGEAAACALRADPRADIQGALGEALADRLIHDFT